MKLKDVEIVVMSDEEYGEHLNQLFGRLGAERYMNLNPIR